MRTAFATLGHVVATLETIALFLTLGVAAFISFVLIAARNLINVSYNSLEEIAVYLVLWMVFIGMAAADRTRSNIRIDILMHVLPERYARILQRIADALTSLLALILAYYALDAVLFSYSINERAVSSLEVKIWWLMVVMPAAFLLVAIRAAIRTVIPPETVISLESAH